MDHNFARNGFPCGALKWQKTNRGFEVAFTYDGEAYAKLSNGQIEKTSVTIEQAEKYGLKL